MNARKPATPPKQPPATETPNEGALRVAGVAEPLDETACRVSGCPKDAEQLGLCGGHFASRRGDGEKPAREEADRG